MVWIIEVQLLEPKPDSARRIVSDLSNLSAILTFFDIYGPRIPNFGVVTAALP